MTKIATIDWFEGWGSFVFSESTVIFCHFFPLCELSHFSTSMYRQWELCKRNSSYNFIQIFLKLCTHFLHGLKMCMWFGYSP